GDRALRVAVGALGDLRRARQLLGEAHRAHCLWRAERRGQHRSREERRQCQQREKYSPTPALHPSLQLVEPRRVGGLSDPTRALVPNATNLRPGGSGPPPGLLASGAACSPCSLRCSSVPCSSAPLCSSSPT